MGLSLTPHPLAVLLAETATPWLVSVGGAVLAALVGLVLLTWLLGIRSIPNDRIGIVEKLWSSRGSLEHGRLVALRGEAGFQAEILRGGIHAGLWPWQYRVHRVPLVSVAQGKLAYVYARDGEPLPPEQTLGRVVACNHFQDAATFLGGVDGARGQRGRQRALLREGVYAINVAAFVVITEDVVHRLVSADRSDGRSVERWHRDLLQAGGFSPIVIGGGRPQDPDAPADEIGIVTTHDGPSLMDGEIIAPAVASDPGHPDFHDHYQDVEAFLRAGGRRGRQLIPLTDGTYFVNRWFATVERLPKTVVPIGHVGVVVSYHGVDGPDLSGERFRHGERAAQGGRGVLEKTLGPGKYAFNTYAGQVHLVPTTNFVLHWITGRTESHRYDESLKSIDLVTADAYEPELPLSVVVHIDYQKAPNVVQRFGDVKRLITQTLDPLLSAYFRDIAHKKTMLQILQDRDLIQREATAALRARFLHFDIELVEVLIGRPSSREGDTKIETLLEQLRQRQLSREQVETYEQQRIAAEKLTTLRLAEAIAMKQTELTNSKVEIEIAQNRGNAELSRARLQADQTVVTAEAEGRRRVLLAEADGRERVLVGEGEAKRVTLRGDAQAGVLRRKIDSFGDARLFALSLVAGRLADSRQALVPERLFVSGGRGGGDGDVPSSPLTALFDLLLAERAGFGPAGPESVADPQRATSTTSEAPASTETGAPPPHRTS